jgi:hypothetical protein
MQTKSRVDDTVKVTRKMLKGFHKIYEQVCENPSINQEDIFRNTRIPRGTVSRYIQEMYDQSILVGPMLFLKPAEDYPLHAAFCEFDNAYIVHERLEQFPRIISSSWNCGKWNIMVVCDAPMDFTLLKGFRSCIYEGAKSLTFLSQVSFLDWSASMGSIQAKLSPPEKKTTLYEIGPSLQWDKEDWILYEKVKQNTRVKITPLLKECSLSYERYRKWIAKVHRHPSSCVTQTAFYPHGLNTYFCYDFLFNSNYHRQLTDILGMLPSTSIFFSVGSHLFARISVMNTKESQDLFSLMVKLKEYNYFTDYYTALVASVSKNHNKNQKELNLSESYTSW